LIRKIRETAQANNIGEVKRLLVEIKTFSSTQIYKDNITVITELENYLSRKDFTGYCENVIDSLTAFLQGEPEVTIEELEESNSLFIDEIRDVLSSKEEVENFEREVRSNIRKIKIQKNVDILVSEAEEAENDEEKKSLIILRVNNFREELEDSE
jgi:hypothetical protein